jgi:hypothetical protein
MSGLALHAGGGMFKMAQTRYSGIGEYAELTTAVMKSSKGTIALPGSHQATLSFAHGRYGVSVQVTAGKPISIPAVVAAAHVIDSRLHGG